LTTRPKKRNVDLKELTPLAPGVCWNIGPAHGADSRSRRAYSREWGTARCRAPQVSCRHSGDREGARTIIQGGGIPGDLARPHLRLLLSRQRSETV